MTFGEIIKRAEKLTIDNSPAILTAIGVTGTLTTAYLTGKATFKAAKLIEDQQFQLNLHEHRKHHKLNNKEKAQLVWKVYIPPATMASVTVAAIISANRIGNRRAAAMATAYALSEKAFTEYREKIVEKLGDRKEQAARDEIAQERVNRDPVGKHEVIVTGGGEVLCYDSYTGRYFYSDMETLKKAQNDTNFHVLNDMYASLNDFYSRIGLSAVKFGEEVGWNCDKMLELNFSTTMSDDQKPCICMDFAVAPIRDYHRLH